MDQIEKNLLKEIADLHDIPAGAYNIRRNGESGGRNSTEHIQIVSKEEPLCTPSFFIPPTTEAY